ncbi:nicotinate-nucleotide adenylyltransferase [Ktedonospora formicarum]|uniref:Probable nicotinate-nucleotide adenylyltransferase n=1 Tax=Ktedonospora formicarum TaxID=2778364 RepID=A0A8J3I4H8_9CHLR|nr:nicotinate-nucleotide adenylyltransferase [Ktedonospora formicarum]GHO45274.1 putative nicotinate-nucleotide adenylyltransferase [Ktedonospora formicarum]
MSQQQTQQHDAQSEHIGIMGGTFDPIHNAHLAVAEEVRVALNLSSILFIPTGQPPHKRNQQTTPASRRLAMVECAIATNPYFTCSRIEIDRDGPSYTVDTLHRLREQYGSKAHFYFIIGWDSLLDLHGWYNPQGILAELTALVAVGRPGYPSSANSPQRQTAAGKLDNAGYNTMLEERLPGITQRLRLVQAPLLDISSTDLRQRVAQGQPIRYQTPDAVVDYIREHHLYIS